MSKSGDHGCDAMREKEPEDDEMLCSICLSTKHVAASCPLRPRPIDKVIAFVALVFILSGYAWSHEWYDNFCCSGHDCEPVQNVTYVASEPKSLPLMMVTTSLGTKPVTSQTRILDSKDSRMHGCIFQDRLICIYMPPGN